MIPDLSFYVNLLFVLTVILCFWLFNHALKSRRLFFISIAWLLLTGILAYKGFFLDFSAVPPRLMLILIIPLAAIILTLFIPAGSAFINGIQLRPLVLLSIVRVPVELALYLLFLNKMIPGLMTFAGRNFDILAGISAPFIYFICFRKNELTNRRLLLGWHFISLGLLLNIVINALLSAPFPIQQFAFEQPNRAVFYFPYVWLPAYIVMAVLFSHLISISRLLTRK